MDDLTLMVDNAADKVRTDETDFQLETAKQIVAASDGKFEGFSVTRTDDEANGVFGVETDFIRAKRNINLAGSMNPDLEAAALRASEKTGLPVSLLRSMDNQEMTKPDLQKVAPETLRFIGANLSHAAIVKDDVEKVNDVVETAQYASLSPEERRKALTERIKREGYTPSQLADLKNAGYSVLPDDPSGKNGKFSMDSMKAFNATVTWPVLEKWFTGPGEIDYAKRQQEAQERWNKVFKNGFDNVRGSAWLVGSTDATAESYIKRLDKEIVVMRGLYSLYGDQWRSFDDKELESAIQEVGAAMKLDVKDMSVVRFRPAGVGWETDWGQVFNWFGMVSAMDHQVKLNQKELDEVHRNPSNFSMADKMELVDYLEKQARELRGRTGWNAATEGTLGSIRFMTEFAATSGMSVAPSAIKGMFSEGLLKGAPKFLKALAVGELKRLPAYIPGAAQESLDAVRPQVTQLLQEGVVLPGMTEDETSELANVFFNKALNTYIENYSEGLGALAPTGKVLAPLAKFVPQRIKNAVFVQIAKNVIGNVSTSKGAKLAGIIYEKSMFNGLTGEYLEEKWGDAIRKIITSLAQTFGTKYGDLGQTEIFGTTDEEMQLMGTLLLTSLVVSAPRAPSVVGDIRRSAQFVDAQRAIKDRVDATATEQRSPETMEILLQGNNSGTAYLTPDDARTLYQSQPEVMESIGVTEDMIGAAEAAERMVPVSMARVHTRTDRAAFDTLLAKLIPDPKHTLTQEQAEKIDLSAEAQAVAEATDKARTEAKAAYDEALAQLTALGRSATEIRAASKLLSMAEYFGQHSNMTAAEWIRNVAFEKMKEEDFLKRLSQQSDALYQHNVFANAIQQKFSSGATSLSQVAAGFKKIKFQPGTVNLDLGGGKFDEGTKYLAAQGVTNLVYDPVNRSAESNTKIFETVKNGGVDTVTCNNVLNVIGEAPARSNVILQAAKALKPGGVAYFTVYEGNGSGVGKQSQKDSWQNNRKTESYVSEIEEHFGSVIRRGKIIEARDPKIEDKTASWFNEGFGADPVMYQISPVWTGSAAYYDKPSLMFIGTGEGAQVYGWGLYGSSSREIGEWYAHEDHKRKTTSRVTYGVEYSYKDLDRGDHATTGLDRIDRDALKAVLNWGSVSAAKSWLQERIIYFSGRKAAYISEGRSPDQLGWLDDQVWDMEQQLKFLEEEGENIRLSVFHPYTIGDQKFTTAEALISELGLSEKYGEAIRGGLGILTELANGSQIPRDRILEELDSFPENPEYKAAAQFIKDYPEFEIRLPRNLYQQTFWPDRQEDLLDWDKEVKPEQIEKVVKELADILVDKDSLYNYAVFDGVRGVASERGISQENNLSQIEAELIIGEHLGMYHGYKNGRHLYEYVTDILGSSPRTASEFLYRAGIDGITYIGDSSNVRNYVAFSDADIRIDDHIMYQSGTARRGATTFNDAWEATVTLFEGAADASTLIHETGHYAFEMMRHLVEIGAADERMQSDFAKLQKWAEEGTTDPIEQKERLARAFEAYCIEGKAPTVELEGAFATLRRLLLHVYKSIKALGVELNDEVRTVFDGMLASDETLNNESILREVTSQINRELLGLTQSEVRVFRDLIEKSNAQAIAELTAEKNRELAKLRPQWRQEANDLMKDDRVYNAWNAILKEGGIDYVALEEICGEYLASKLRKKGLTTNPGRKSKAKVDKKTGEVIRPAGYYSAKSGKHPASFAAENGFESVEQMVDELSYAQSPKDFMSEYMADAERRFNAEFEISESALSVQASVEALEKLSELLAVKGGKQGFSIRRAMLKRSALDEIDGMKVRDIVSDRKLVSDCRMNARKLTKAANDGDFATAFDQAQKLRYNLEVLRQKVGAKKEIARTERLMSRARHAKKGSVYGDHQEALIDLSLRFGFYRKELKAPLAHTVVSVIEEYNSEARENGEPIIDAPAWLLAGSRSFRDLTFAELQDLTQLAEFLYGEGRALVAARESQLKEKVKEYVVDCVTELAPQKHNKVKHYGAAKIAYEVPQWGTKLRNIFGEAGRWKPDSAFQKLLDEMNYAESEQCQLMENPLRETREAIDALYSSTTRIDLSKLSHIKFPEDVIAHGYKKWDAEKIVMCCLNMGNAKNRQRLKDGFSSSEYQWTEDTLNEIASLLSAEDWGNIQKIWNAIGKGNLTKRVKQTFKEERHFDLKEEEALPFPVLTSDGLHLEMEGGYFPLDYLYHKNTVVQDMVEAKAQYNPPAFRRASFTFERAEELADPLNLSVNIIGAHIFDAAHYVSHKAVMRKVMRVINDYEFKRHFQQTQGFERYAAMKKLVENVAAPGAALKGFTSGFEDWMRAVVTSSSLWASPSVVAMQLSSATIGVDELGHYWFEAVAYTLSHPLEAKKDVLKKSGMMRDRINSPDLDLKRSTGRFQKNKVERLRDRIIEYGYTPMRVVDLAVAIPAWRAAFNQAVDKGMTDSQAAAVADEFVAKTQGATRAIDMSPLQLEAWGRCVTVFFSAVSAGSTMAVKTGKRVISGDMTAQEAVSSIAANIIIPMVLGAAIRALLSGSPDDDPDKAKRAFYRELMANPFQGVPLVRDVADFVAGGVSRELTGKPFMMGKRTVFENTAFRGASDITITAIEGMNALADGNPERALYKISDAVGTLFKVPVVRVYERARRMLADWTNDPELLPDFDKETKTKK